MKGHPLAALLLSTATLLPGQNLKEFEKNISEFTLGNGLHFIVLERHQAPVVSFHTGVNAGAVDDPEGKTGIAHMFEHMAFKGTEFIGSRNWPEEKKALADVERLYDRVDAERNKRHNADPEKVKLIEAELKGAMDHANDFVVPNLYPEIIEQNGGVGLNASTGEDSTDYFYNLPANRIELWFLLESQRFLHPVFREFYKERSVVLEERRLRVESNPQGKLMEAALATAIEAHPYRRMAGGWASDIEHLRVGDAEEFFRKYYSPSNLVISIVGDVQPADIRRLAERYFGPIGARPLPEPVITVEPPQEGPKHAVVESPSQPFALVAFKRPDQYHKDDPVFDVIAELLSGGRTGLIYQQLVRDQQIALDAGAIASLPGGKYPNLFVLYLVPSAGRSAEENQKALSELLQRFARTKVDPQSLARVKTKTRAGLIRQLDNNAGLAQLLNQYQVAYGDWRKLFTGLDEINKVTADDVQRVAQEYFIEKSATYVALRQPGQGVNAGASAPDGAKP